MTLKKILIIVLAIAVYTGVRYVGSAIHYGCADPAEDCPPPIYGAGQLGWYLTGGSLVPLWNRDAILHGARDATGESPASPGRPAGA